MRAHWMFALTALALSACASPPPEPTPLPPPPAPEQAPAPPPAGVAAPGVAAPPAPRPAPERGGEVVVPGQTEQQVQPPRGDPRTAAQRMEDIRNWDRCVMQVHSTAEADPLRPQMEQPEDYCARTLGQADRLAVPASRLQRR